jgi:hypothetical protein
MPHTDSSRGEQVRGQELVTLCMLVTQCSCALVPTLDVLFGVFTGGAGAGCVCGSALDVGAQATHP